MDGEHGLAARLEALAGDLREMRSEAKRRDDKLDRWMERHDEYHRRGAEHAATRERQHGERLVALEARLERRTMAGAGMVALGLVDFLSRLFQHKLSN